MGEALQWRSLRTSCLQAISSSQAGGVRHDCGHEGKKRERTSHKADVLDSNYVPGPAAWVTWPPGSQPPSREFEWLATSRHEALGRARIRSTGSCTSAMHADSSSGD